MSPIMVLMTSLRLPIRWVRSVFGLNSWIVNTPITASRIAAQMVLAIIRTSVSAVLRSRPEGTCHQPVSTFTWKPGWSDQPSVSTPPRLVVSLTLMLSFTHHPITSTP